MSVLEDLLAKGYFPKELPPGFSTQSFATFACKPGSPPSFTFAKISPRICHFNLARTKGLRRRLGIPNPIPHYELCKAIDANLPALQTRIGTSRLSVSTPIQDPAHPRAFLPQNREGRLIDLRAERRTAATVILRADVADFYPSIYSHSIPWALHTKITSKAQKSNMSLCGNLIDKWIRASQDGQTMGIPIGPDTSFLIAEVIMAAVEEEYCKQFPTGYMPKGFRFYDDIELSFASRAEAEASIPKLEKALASFELRLNPTKTSVEALPQNLGESWTADIRSFHFRPGSQKQRLDLIRYFERLFELIGQGCSETVIAYAMSRLDGTDIEKVD